MLVNNFRSLKKISLSTARVLARFLMSVYKVSDFYMKVRTPEDKQQWKRGSQADEWEPEINQWKHNSSKEFNCKENFDSFTS